MIEKDVQERAKMISDAVKPMLNALHNHVGIPVAEINSFTLGLIFASMQNDMGKEASLVRIEQIITNIWERKENLPWYAKLWSKLSKKLTIISRKIFKS